MVVGWYRGVNTLAETWNGASWRLMRTRDPAPDRALTSVSCASMTDCVAVGEYDKGCPSCTPRNLSEVWNGTS